MGCIFSKKKSTVAVIHTDNKYVKKIISAEIRQEVWKKYAINENLCNCYVCGTPLLRKGWHCSHVIAEIKGGKTIIDNLRVCCAHCNLSMGDLNLYKYIENKIEKGVKIEGLGAKHYKCYLKENPQFQDDKRTNNWRRYK